MKHLRIIIDGKEFFDVDMKAWKNKHVRKALKVLQIPFSQGDDNLEKNLNEVKMSLTYEEMMKKLSIKLRLANFGMRMAVLLSGKRRKYAKTTIYASGITVETLGNLIDDVMMNNTPENRQTNLEACPEHYVLNPSENGLEVVETTGNSPLPTQFFITFNDESELTVERDFSYPYQSVGIAKLSDGTVIGGVRHQFKNTQEGIEAQLLVGFPAICPNVLIREHQKHLAVEWSHWVKWAIEKQS